MDTRLTFCPLHLQQWMTGSRFFVSFFSRSFLFPTSLCRSHPPAWRPPHSLTMWHSVFATAVEVLGFFFLLICLTSTICIETIHRLDTFLIRTFVPLLLTANTDQPHTLCLCNNNARIILIIRIIITLITVVINILFIHKSWQQIRHGDAHDSRTQNSKAVQKHEFVFTLRMSVYLHFCPLDGCTKGFFLSHAPHIHHIL